MFAGCKRAIDIIVAMTCLIFASPVMLMVAVVLRWTMGSPVIFRQVRPGRHGVPFTIYKLRTMRDDTDDQGRPLSDAERLTRLGGFLRSTSLDELPQLVNVIKGDMSLVGPRPLLMDYLPRYTAEQARRHHVRPGITGWAQVNGRNALSWEEKFQLDVWYVDNQGLRLDIKILWMTLLKVAKRVGVRAAGHATMPEFPGNSESSTAATELPSVVVIGGGGHAKVVIAALLGGGRRIQAVCDDDESKVGRRLLGLTIRPPAWDSAADADLLIAVGDNSTRERIAADHPDRQWTTAIHPSAHVDDSVQIGVGTVVCAGAVVQPDAVIGAHVIINTGAAVDHDCVVGDFAHIGPGVRIAGNVEIGRGAFLGIGSVVLPGVRVGERTTVGAGAVVTRDLPAGVVALGVPAKVRAVESAASFQPAALKITPAA